MKYDVIGIVSSATSGKLIKEDSYVYPSNRKSA